MLPFLSLYSLNTATDTFSNVFSLLLYVVVIAFTLNTFAHIYSVLLLETPVENYNAKYFDYLYFSIVTFTTLGFGDFTPSPESRMYAATQAVLGYIYLGILVGKIISVSTSKKSSFNNFEKTSNSKSKGEIKKQRITLYPGETVDWKHNGKN